MCFDLQIMECFPVEGSDFSDNETAPGCRMDAVVARACHTPAPWIRVLGHVRRGQNTALHQPAVLFEATKQHGD